MLLGPRHRTAVHATAATSTSPETSNASPASLLEDGGTATTSDNGPHVKRNHSTPHLLDSKKKHGPLPWRTRARAIAKRAAVWGSRAALALAAWCCVFAWARRRAMLSVVRGASRRASAQMFDEIAYDESAAKFTVLVNTFKRTLQLEGAIRHYSTCGSVDSIRVVWSEQSSPPDRTTGPQFFEFETPVQFQQHPTTSLNNRFIPPPDMATEGVFVVDDDIAVPCKHLQAAFETWQRHPDALVGFFPRSHAAPDKGEGMWEYLYFWRVLWNMEYSMVLTKAAFVHVKYLHLYSGPLSREKVGKNNAFPAGRKRGYKPSHYLSIGGLDSPSDDAAVADSGWIGDELSGGDMRKREAVAKAMVHVREYVNDHRNCEDIAMQMAVTSISGTAPIAAFAPVKDIGLLGGISTGEGSGKWWQAPHAIKRSRCLADLNEIFCLHTNPTRADAAHVADPMAYTDDHGMAGKELGKHQEGDQQEHERQTTCETLRRTNLFAVPPRPAYSAATGTERRVGLRGRGVREAERGRGEAGAGGGVGEEGSDLLHLSRWGLAVRAPTLAEFLSADMLLVPGKFWRWLTQEDIFGRKSLG